MKKILLILILVIAFSTRFFLLGDILALHRDEAFLGYNAYSILHTAKDMSGNFLPLHLQSFLYSPAGYSYFSIPFIFLFDINSFSIRFASALFGFLTIILLFFFVKVLFERNKYKNQLALLSAFFLSISPWHINLSRTATENTVVTFFILLGVLLLLLYKKSGNVWLLLLSFVSFLLTMFIYQAPRAFLPLFIPIIFLILFDVKNIFRKRTSSLFLYILLIVLPVLFVLTSQNLSLRIKSLSIFNNSETGLVIHEQITIDGVQSLPIIVTRIFHNKIINYSLVSFENYVNHFSFENLFFDGGLPDRYRIPHMGLLYLFEIPLLIFALFVLFAQEKRQGILLVSWILIAPVGSALTFDDIPNLQRTLISAPIFSILSAYGLVIFYIYLKKKSFSLAKIVLVPVAFVIIYSFCYYLIQYYIQTPLYRPWYRQDGYKELVSKVNKFLPDYKYAVVTNRESAPTLFFLFYGKVSPKDFQGETKNATMKDFDRIGFGKYKFSQEECPVKEILDSKDGTIRLTGVKDVLYVNSGLCPPPRGNVKVLSEVKRKDNSVVFRILSLDK